MDLSPDGISFLVFLFLVVLLFHALTSYKAKLIVIVAANISFYVSFGTFYFLMHLLLVLLAYLLAILISKKTKRTYKILWSAGLLLVPLLFFKTGAGEALLQLVGKDVQGSWTEAVKWTPIGLSFYTFTLVGYLCDVYNGYVPAEKNFLRLFAFAGFFPTILAGPIERSRGLLMQLKNPLPAVSTEQMNQGLLWIFWGIFKKKVIANNCAFVVDRIFAEPNLHAGYVLYLTAFLFLLQIFADFSAYSDIATGAANLLGIQVMPNFHPALFASPSRNIHWKRWHMSLTSWFRDYVFYPLSKGKKSTWVLQLNIILVFVLTGLWHGLSFAFLLWGLLNGILLILEQKFIKWRKQHFLSFEDKKTTKVLYTVIGIIITIHINVFLGLLFRMETFTKFVDFLSAMGNKESIVQFNMRGNIVLIFFSLIAMGVLSKYIVTRNPLSYSWLLTNRQVWIILFFLITLILYLGHDAKNTFYYFRF